MPKFRKKPVVIEAVPVVAFISAARRAAEGVDAAWQGMPEWAIDAWSSATVVAYAGHVIVKTFEGEHRGEFGDWLLRGVKGELYPCKPDIFEMTYEPVEESSCPDPGCR